MAQLRAQIVPWSTLCRADWVRNDPVLTTRGWLLRQLRPSFSGSCARPGEHQGISLMRLGKWASGGDCGSTSPRSLDELAQLRTHTDCPSFFTALGAIGGIADMNLLRQLRVVHNPLWSKPHDRARPLHPKADTLGGRPLGPLRPRGQFDPVTRSCVAHRDVFARALMFT